MKIIGEPFEPQGFENYLEGLDFSHWSPSVVVLHHTAAPSLAQRPKGFFPVHMQNLRYYYEKECGWSAGPHLFVDEKKLWVFSPLTSPGVHARSFNSNGLGVEMLGDYDTEDPWTGRGLRVLTTTARGVKSLLSFFKLSPSAIRFHRDDPRTTKTCPGKRIPKACFLELLASV